MVSSAKTPAERIREALPRLGRSVLLLAAVLLASFLLIPVIQGTLGLALPGVGLTIGFVLLFILFAFLFLAAFRFVVNLLALVGLTTDFLSRRSTGTAPEHALLKGLFNLVFLIIILTGYVVLSPHISRISTIGPFIVTSSGILIVALVTLFFWDVARSIYRKIDELATSALAKMDQNTHSAHVVRGLLRAFIYLLVTIITIGASYAIQPSLEFAFDLTIPGIGISVGQVIYVLILGLLGFALFGFIRSLTGVLGLHLEQVVNLIPVIASGSVLKRIAYDVVFALLVLVVFWALSPFIPRVPGIGEPLGVAAQLIAFAILILLFWDIGKNIYGEVDRAVERIIPEGE